MSDAETWVDDGIANTLNQYDVGDVRSTHAVVGFSHTQGLDPQAAEEVTPTLRKNGGGAAVSIAQNQRGELREAPIAPAVTHGGGKPGEGYSAARIGPTVRRLTPLECERLMGWPDNWTDIPWNGKDHAPDSRRYAACGNGVVAPVAYWIGARLAEVLRHD